MTIHQTAAKIVSLVPEMHRDSAVNNEMLVTGILKEMLIAIGDERELLQSQLNNSLIREDVFRKTIVQLGDERDALKQSNEKLQASLKFSLDRETKAQRDNERLRSALQVADECLDTTRVVVENEIRYREIFRVNPTIWPDVLTGCVSGGGIMNALAVAQAALKKEVSL